MLVLTRRIGEEIVIADNIRLTVVNVKHQRVRLGITAPPSVHVVRLELLGECTVVAGPLTAGRSGKSREGGGAPS
jgi:carbon storage regulator